MHATAVDLEKLLVEQAFSLRHDPLEFILFSFDGLEVRVWQREILVKLGDRLKQGELSVHEAIQFAVSSGHGIGKSA